MPQCLMLPNDLLIGVVGDGDSQKVIRDSEAYQIKIGLGQQINSLQSIRNYALDAVLIFWSSESNDFALGDLLSIKQPLIFVVNHEETSRFMNQCELYLQNAVGKMKDEIAIESQESLKDGSNKIEEKTLTPTDEKDSNHSIELEAEYFAEKIQKEIDLRKDNGFHDQNEEIFYFNNDLQYTQNTISNNNFGEVIYQNMARLPLKHRSLSQKKIGFPMQEELDDQFFNKY